MRAAGLIFAIVLSVVVLQAAMAAHAAEGAAVAAEDGRFWIDPPTFRGVDQGDIFTVTVMAENVQDMVGYAFELYWNSSVLTPTEPYVVDAGFLLEEPSTSLKFLEGGPDQVGFNFEAFVFPPPYEDGADGDGPLAVITFQAVGEGTSELRFDTADVEWYDAEELRHIPDVSAGEVIVGRRFVFLPVVLRGY